MKKKETESKLLRQGTHIDALWAKIKYLLGEINKEHSRISVLAPKVDLLDSDVRKFTEFFNSELQEFRKQDEVLGNIMRVLKQSGIIEEAVKGDDLLQMINTVDRLQRNPLYKINKVVTK